MFSSKSYSSFFVASKSNIFFKSIDLKEDFKQQSYGFSLSNITSFDLLSPKDMYHERPNLLSEV